MEKAGTPRWRWASTSTGRASSPTRAWVVARASTPNEARLRERTKRSALPQSALGMDTFLPTRARGTSGNRRSLELERNTVEPAAADSDDFESDFEPRQSRVPGEPDLRCPTQPPLLFVADRLAGIAIPRARACLHLAEDDSPAAAQDDVELVPARPHVRREDPVPP